MAFVQVMAPGVRLRSGVLQCNTTPRRQRAALTCSADETRSSEQEVGTSAAQSPPTRPTPPYAAASPSPSAAATTPTTPRPAATAAAAFETSSFAPDDKLSEQELNGEKLSATAQALLEDVATNPAYYVNVSGVLLGLSLSVVVLSAAVVAIDSLPVLPDVLRMVGLIYTFWFLAKYLFSASEREHLTDEVEELVAGVRGGQYRVLNASDSMSSTRAELQEGPEGM